jgi:hypothetical protein
MTTSERYNETELREVAEFLRANYVLTASRISSARPRNPGRAVAPELERLRSLSPLKKETALQITDRNLEELEAALASPYPPDLANIKEAKLQDLRKDVESLPPMVVSSRYSLALLVLKNTSHVICAKHSPVKIKTFTISTASLSLLLRHLGIDPLFAPMVVWVATALRNFGIPVFCGSVKDYLAAKGIT